MKHYPDEEKVNYDEEFFTVLAYDKFAHCESQDIFRRQIEMIEDVIGSFSDKRTLDIGGALGWFAKRCLDKGADSYCQDISEWACNNSPVPDRMRCGDICNGILFEDNYFDVVTGIEVFEHISSPQNALREVARVLKPGGYVYLSIGLSATYSHVWVGKLDEWDAIVNDTPGLELDIKLSDEMRNHPYCILQHWSAIIARAV